MAVIPVIPSICQHPKKLPFGARGMMQSKQVRQKNTHECQMSFAKPFYPSNKNQSDKNIMIENFRHTQF